MQALTQVQIIKSLGEALSWLEREMDWGVAPSNLPHLTGRIGELYAAMVTRGQMALATNQRGYDVVSAEGEHISVKTITTSVHVTFNAATFDNVDRVMVLRIVFDETDATIEEVLDCSAAEARQKMSLKDGKYKLSTYKSQRTDSDVSELRIAAEATHGPYRVIQFENATIIVENNGIREPIAKPALRQIALEIGVEVLNGSSKAKNTRTLGSDIIKTLHAF